MKRFSILIAALCLCLTGCGKQTTEATAQIFAMDTVMDLTAYGSQVDAALTSAEDTIRELEAQLSRTQADSLVSRLNREGVADIIQLNLTEEEQKEFAASCKTMDENYRLALTL